MKNYAVVLNGGLTIHKNEGRVRWTPRMKKIIKQHVEMYYRFEYATQQEAFEGIFKELNARFKNFNGTIGAISQQFYKIHSASEKTAPVYGNQKKIASCKIVIEYNDGTTLEMPVRVPKGVHVSV